VVDVAKRFTNILFDEQQKTITPQPGIVRGFLERILKPGFI
jgi:hypothetical protein